MSPLKAVTTKVGHGFFDEAGRWYLVRCFKCGRENWAPAVADGRCAWCGAEGPPAEPERDSYETTTERDSECEDAP